MANKRLIDAKDMERQIKEALADTTPYGMGLMLRWVRVQPTVDAVEVVRCKDCSWFNKSGYEEDNEHEEDSVLHMGFCLYWRRGTQACRFCSFGERREGE